MTEKGKLIVVEGACDGIGKTTQYNKLKNWLNSEGHIIESHHFPSYGTPQAAPVEKFLKGELGNLDKLSPYFVNSLYAIDRAITWHEKLSHAYEETKILVLDRYTTSSLIYQSALFDNVNDKKSFIEHVVDYEYNKMGIKSPDLVLFLHAPFDLITNFRNARKENEGIEKDVFERDIELQRKVYESGLFVCEMLNWDVINCCEKESMRSVENIHNDIKSLVKKKCL